MLVSLKKSRLMWFALILWFSILSSQVLSKSDDQRLLYWTTVKTDAPFFNSTKLYSLFELHSRWNDTDALYDTLLVRYGIGHKINQVLSFIMGSDFLPMQNNQGDFVNEIRFWVRAQIEIADNSQNSVQWRSWINWRHRENESQNAYNLRERLHFDSKKPLFFNWHPTLFDEVFLNLNHPSWTNNNLIEQNRLFIGGWFPLNETLKVELGYLNQLQIKDSQNIMNHILWLTLAIQ